jgi:hypothetical protein
MDSLEEWRRLQELYSRMNEGELEVIANEACDLTDVARSLLKDEISRRGLAIQLRTARSAHSQMVETRTEGFDPADLELETMGEWVSREDANKIKEFLTESGVPCYWGPDLVENPTDVRIPFEEGVEMKVRTDDVPRVRGGIALLFPKDAEADARDFSVLCPRCHSPEIVFQDLDATAKFYWSCDACGYQWNDDGVEQEA